MISSSLTTVEISRKNLIHNLRQFRKRIKPGTKIMAVVKANAYGHGIKEAANVFSRNGADWLGVNSEEEGVLLREEGIKLPIFVLGYIPQEKIEEAIKNDLSFVVYHREIIKKANQEAKRLNKKAKIHLKVETGTNRQGVDSQKTLALAKLCQSQACVLLEGVCTHYANIEDTLDPDYALEQMKIFKKALQLIKAAKIKIPFKHSACSAATILFDETHFNLIRPGIGLYGLWPSRETKISARGKGIKFNLKPALTWKTKVAQVKEVKKGETVGYGRTFRTSRKTKIAVLPVGYYDGYDRKLSGQGRVLVRGRFAPVLGRVCMNMIMVDITDIAGVKPEDEVVLLGKQGRNEITTEEIAQKVGTINYEITTRINPFLPRKIA